MTSTRSTARATPSTWAVLLAAALVGLTCGAVTAVVRPGPGAAPQAASAAGDAPEEDRPAAGRLLYLDGDTLHDGGTTVTVRHDFGGEVQRLVRAREGWVLAEHTGTTEPQDQLWHVRPDGSTTPIDEVFGPWDLDPDGTRVAGVDVETGDVRVWTLGGRVVAEAGVISEQRAVMWSGPDTVLITSLVGDDGSWRVWRWPMGRAPRLTTAASVQDATAARDGGLLVGEGARGGVAAPDDRTNTCLTVVAPPGTRAERVTQTCDWVPMAGTGAVFSPDGGLVLAMPSDTDGFGPPAAATFSAREGVRSDYAELRLPERSLGAQWLDDDHLVVTVASDLELDDGTGTELQVCPRQGGPDDCRTVATRDPGTLLAGEQY